MRSEHCDVVPESKTSFATKSSLFEGRDEVTPRAQWHYVMLGADAARGAGEVDLTFESGDIAKRNGEPIEVYEHAMEQKNALLAARGDAPILKEELVGARLYSGCVRSAVEPGSV